MAKTISFGLSSSDITRAIKKLDAYREEIARKAELLRERVAQEIVNEAQNGFDSSIVDDLLRGGGRPASVSVTTMNDGGMSLVIAKGSGAIWCEFGAGVYHNGAAGTSPHPNGETLGMTIGSYGEGHGKRNVWGYYEDGELKLTHGTPATMPMYNAAKAVCDRITEIAMEVFG